MEYTSLSDFLADIMRSLEDEPQIKDRFFFELQRYSLEEPFWCLFAKKHEADGNTSFAGHYCLSEENVQVALTAIADCGYPCTVQTMFYFIEGSK